MTSALFRLIASTGQNMIVANTFGSFATLLFFAVGGFVLSKENIKKWWKWGVWSSPLMYAHTSIMVNEFLAKSWRHSHGFFTESYWYWLGVGAQIGFLIDFNICYTYLDPQHAKRPEKRGQVISSAAVRSGAVVEANQNKKKGMLLPFQPHSITFDNIRYSVDMPEEMKNQGVLEDRLELLKGVSGAFRPGVLTALMVLEVLVKSLSWMYWLVRKLVDILRLPSNVDSDARKVQVWLDLRLRKNAGRNFIVLESNWVKFMQASMFINEVMELMELIPLKGALVGLPGLDARAAAIIMRTVRNTVDIGRTVVCTIHQPSIDIFEAFDEGIEGVSKIKENYNPATWMSEVTTTAQEPFLTCGIYFRRNKDLIEELSQPTPGSKEHYFPTQYSQPFFTQRMANLWKQRLSYWRNTPYTVVRFLFTDGIALMFGTMLWDLGTRRKRSTDLNNAIGAMFSAVIFLGIQNSAFREASCS
ncbi:ABC transporter G family member 40 [Vitis vinifera]|uniref:ABC transporter G family member 40 n=1 Tax=Vitis vinifera TaxID=29760 RepID=A0A438GZJ0_VITVI|nr:ABC transporter G family member 40 [Vitis vinifera]